MEAFLHDLSWVPPLRNDLLTHVFNGFTFLAFVVVALFLTAAAQLRRFHQLAEDVPHAAD